MKRSFRIINTKDVSFLPIIVERNECYAKRFKR